MFETGQRVVLTRDSRHGIIPRGTVGVVTAVRGFPGHREYVVDFPREATALPNRPGAGPWTCVFSAYGAPLKPEGPSQYDLFRAGVPG